jgi:demethylmenaquinone methyltransferase/2-methoxy-6-polyprenyl-1,4-benzoquinol methylase
MVRNKEVLEFAAGTGLWTKRLLDAGARWILAVDGSPETLEFNRARTKTHLVEYEIADVFAWNPTRVFDIVFFSFWLSHVPQSRFDAFWNIVRRSLRPGGKVLFLDSLLEQTSTATDHKAVNASGIAHRKLNDGREFQIVKIFYDSETLQSRLAQLGWEGAVQSSGKFFLFGLMEP